MKSIILAVVLSFAFQSAEASLLAKVKEAKLAYREWKSANPEAAKTFRANHKAMKKMLNDKNSELYASLSIAKEICANDKSQCQTAMNTFVQPEFEKIMGVTNSISIQSDPSVEGYVSENVGFHALLFGAEEMDEATFSNYGPGLWVGASAMIIACANSRGGINYGVTAGASVLVGIQTGLYFGRSGICTMLGLNLGMGAYAGFSILDL